MPPPRQQRIVPMVGLAPRRVGESGRKIRKRLIFTRFSHAASDIVHFVAALRSMRGSLNHCAENWDSCKKKKSLPDSEDSPNPRLRHHQWLPPSLGWQGMESLVNQTQISVSAFSWKNLDVRLDLCPKSKFLEIEQFPPSKGMGPSPAVGVTAVSWKHL